MAIQRRLTTDSDFEEAMAKQHGIRVFRDDQIVDSGGIIIRFDENTIILQAGVGDLSYHPRSQCEFFELRRR
ncbi:hypothetical protein [Cohnella fermenti]|uniref:Uncharacterized protein n=1 Tax=Cohnella fermenti TaxID=2565925 RepID=A0A4V6RXJ6_9BACL|nr:hypothetical protein [Cohnella fermenti]THF78063.1 hypothetical protein E6C55_15325 [Cohnella fermenti]